MSGKRYLADVLWEAANERLHADDGPSSIWGGPKCTWSCNAFALALGKENCVDLTERQRAFLLSLGCNPNSTLLQYDDDEQTAEERQGVRYMWLLLAMHVAEDEGITV